MRGVDCVIRMDECSSGESSSSNASSGVGGVDLHQRHLSVPSPDAFRQCGGSPASPLSHHWEPTRDMEYPPHQHYVMAHPPPTNPGALMASNNDSGGHLSNVQWSTAGELEPLHSSLLQQQQQLCSDYQKPFIVPNTSLNLVDPVGKEGRERFRERDAKRSAAMNLGNGEEISSSDAYKKPRVDQTSGSCAPFKGLVLGTNPIHFRTSLMSSSDGLVGGHDETGRESEFAEVRKEKLGERITALQQLVSPFGKTDTASVLLEAIGYIKFLQEQVQVLSTPYMKPNVSINHDSSGWPSNSSKVKGNDDTRDLRSRGLCLVPVSCTQHVANDNGADFWTPAIGGGCR